MTTALPEASNNQSPEEHMQISRRFIRHAREELGKGERLQASEKIWGAAQHALKAVGKERGWITDNYNHTRAIADHLSAETNQNLSVSLRAYRGYHENFYRNNIGSMGEIAQGINDVERFVNEMQNIRERGPQPFTITDPEQITNLQVVAGTAASGVQVGQTYTGGFVNRTRLARYRNRWEGRDAGGDAAARLEDAGG